MFLALSACLLCAITIADGLFSKTPLRFTQNGTFQLSIFEDLHFGEAEDLDWGPQQDVNTTRVMDSVLDAETQQLVVLNGDLITGENTYLHNSSHYVDQIVQPLVDRHLPWASTYGNHDSAFNLSKKSILRREHLWTNSRTMQMVKTPTSGVSNYFLPVYGANNTGSVPDLILYFFDSRSGNQHQRTESGSSVPIPSWVDRTVVDWFTRTKSRMARRYKKVVPSLAFVHIPVYAALAFQQGPKINSTREPGINVDDPLSPQGISDGQGDVSGQTSYYTGQDTPFMQALLDTQGLIAVFSGHDHGDDWCMKWDSKLPGMNLTGNGLDLCFGRHSGYGGYNRGWRRGSRQVCVSERGLEERSVETWIRVEDGEVSGRVLLNGTYGSDEYPEAVF